MNWDVFITCAVTGAGETTAKSPHVPVTPAQIAESAIDAARAGAAVVHIHVRDPETGVGARRTELYAEVVERIRDSGTDVVVNLTSGMGGDLVLGGDETPLPPADDGTDMAGATERLDHVRTLLPEICTLDCGTMNFASGGDYIMVNSPGVLRSMARQVQELGVRPELEVFDTGHLVMVQELIRDGLIDDPVMIQLCMGIAYGAPDDPTTLLSMVNLLPPDCVFSAFSIGRMQIPYVAMAALAGGNVRVGLEDNLYVGPRQLATNAELVDRAVKILGHERAGDGTVRGPRPPEARQALTIVGLLGGGVIGGGWAARFLLHGADVRLYDPDPDAPRKVGEVVANARRALPQLIAAPLPAEGTLTFVATLEEAVDGPSSCRRARPSDST